MAASTGQLPAVGPQSVSVVLTNACNLNCITCWSYSPLRQVRPAPEWTRQRLERELLRSLFEELAELRTERVIFTGGGDPLAHPEFTGIAADALAAGLKVTLISNLTLLRDRPSILRLGLNTVQANFSCADPATYVAFHPNRTEADYHRLLETLRAIAVSPTELKLVFVVCAVNAHVMEQLLDHAAELGASVQLKLMGAMPETRSLVISEAQRTALVGQREALIRQAERAGTRTNLDAFYAALSGETPEAFPIGEVGCHAGHYYARVDARGNVRFCCNAAPELRVGSLHEESFTALWCSDRWQQLRRRLGEGGFLPGCEQCGKWDLNVRVHGQLVALAGRP